MLCFHITATEWYVDNPLWLKPTIMPMRNDEIK